LLVILIFFFSILIGFGVLRMIPFKPIQLLDDSVQRLFAKSNLLISRSSVSIRDSFVSFFLSPSKYKKIIALEYQIRLKNIEIALNKNYAFENQELKKILKLFEDKDLKVVPCDILYRDLINPMNFTINKGKSEFLKADQAVIYPLGNPSKKIFKYQLVGRIQEVNTHTSKVLSILDAKSKISGRNVRNNALGNVIYDAKRNELFFYTPSESDDFAVGDIVVTSSFSTLPKNLIIGIVQNIQVTASINKKIILATSIDFLRINLVAGVQ